MMQVDLNAIGYTCFDRSEIMYGNDHSRLFRYDATFCNVGNMPHS